MPRKDESEAEVAEEQVEAPVVATEQMVRLRLKSNTYLHGQFHPEGTVFEHPKAHAELLLKETEFYEIV